MGPPGETAVAPLDDGKGFPIAAHVVALVNMPRIVAIMAATITARLAVLKKVRNVPNDDDCGSVASILGGRVGNCAIPVKSRPDNALDVGVEPVWEGEAPCS